MLDFHAQSTVKNCIVLIYEREIMSIQSDEFHISKLIENMNGYKWLAKFT